MLGDEVADRILRQADFFALDAALDWIYQRALLCALPLRLWPGYAAAVNRLLWPGGRVAGFFFIDETADEPRRGPPFAAHRSEIDALFTPGFECITDDEVPAEQSLPVFARRERWIEWRRRNSAPDAAETPGVAS